MENLTLLMIVGLFVTVSFEGVAAKVNCFACSSSDRACKRDDMIEVDAKKDSNCDYCVVLYATNPPNYVLRSCRHDPSGYYNKTECKGSVTDAFEKRCYCHTDWCNGKDMDKFVKGLSQDNTEPVETTPSSLGVSMRKSGHIIGLLSSVLLKMIFM